MRTAAIIPLYNKEAAIARTLRSVLNQTVPVDEIIVVNDGSTDRSEEAARSVPDPRIRIVTTANSGESCARNYAASLAERADVLLLLDADDEWHPRFAETILNLLRQFPNASAAATGYEYMHRDGSVTAPPFCRMKAPGNGVLLTRYFRMAIEGPPLTSSSVGIYKRVFHELGGFCQAQRRGMDLAFWTNLALQAQIAFDPAILATYHLGAANRICESVFVDSAPYTCKILLEHMRSESLSEELRADLAAYYDWQLFDAARQNLIAGRPEIARRVLNRGPKAPRRRDLWIVYMALSMLPATTFRYLYRGWKRRNA